MTAQLDRIRAALAMIDARFSTRSALASARLPQADAAEIVDILIAEFGADQICHSRTPPHDPPRHTIDCLGLRGTARGGSSAALLAWTIAARAALNSDEAAA